MLDGPALEHEQSVCAWLYINVMFGRDLLLECVIGC